MSIYRLIIIASIVFVSNIVASEVQNPFIKLYDNVEKDEKIFLSMLQVEHKRYQKVIQEDIERERLIEERREAIFKAEEEKRKIAEGIRMRLALEKKEEKRKRREKKRRANQLIAQIDLSKQRMTVKKGGKVIYRWKVSTGRKGYGTPKGMYRPTLMKTMHYSKQYNNAPMPYTVFFTEGYAVHGTKSVSRLGKKASHGCVRLRAKNAKKFFKLVRKSGMRNTKIRVVN